MLAMTAMKFAAPHQLLFDKPVEKNYCQPESVSKTNPLKPCRVVELDLGGEPANVFDPANMKLAVQPEVATECAEAFSACR